MLIHVVYATPEQSSYARHARGWWVGLSENLATRPDVHVHLVHTSELDHTKSHPDVCIYVGDPRRWQRAFHPNTQKRWIAVMPNSDRILDGVLHAVADANANILTPSHWAKGVISSELVRQRIPFAPVLKVVGLGVEHDEVRSIDQVWDGNRPIAVLHRTSSATGRKGTRELIGAWITAVGEGWVPADSYLTITVPEPILAGGIRDMYPGGHPNILVLSKADPTDRVGEFHRKFDLCIQPSAAESWGLVPLECLSVGVPALVSDCPGHLAWGRVLAGEREIPLRGLVPCDECPGAKWGLVDEEAIRMALKRTMGDGLDDLQRAQIAIAHDVQATFSWAEATREFASVYLQ